MDTPPIDLYLNHVEVGATMEWDWSTEEVLGGVGKCKIRLQDRTNTYEPQAHWDVKLVIHATGWVLFRGEILTPTPDLQLGVPWRTWELDCVDYSWEFGWRLVGAFDGKTWMDTSGLGIYVNIDPHAQTLRTDKLTIQNWIDNYIRVDGTAIETTTYVGEYLYDFLPFSPAYGKLQNGLEQLAAYVAGNLQFWLDPDLKFHWVLIPAWQDLIDEAMVVYLDATAATSALMFPETAPELIALLGIAPYEVSAVDGNPDGSIGFHELKITPDGSTMPEQVYVKGGTGYVYNAPPIEAAETKTVVSAPIAGAEGTYQLYITENNTKLWHVDSTGYVSISYDLAPIGGPWPVQWYSVPWNEDRNKGGHYWKFLSGPYAGKLADDNTNYLANYGGIRVELVSPGSGPAPDPQIGTGGSGWTNEVTQDRTKRQAYLEAPISTTRTMRDSLGGQALYRGRYPTLRGSFRATGYDGWRVGQLVKITDDRLPWGMSGKYFVIQRVQAKAITETEVRQYTIDWGDGPTSRYTYQSHRASDFSWPHPANQLVIDAHDLTPGPNSSQTITGRLVNSLGEAWRIAGKVVEWTFECYSASGALQTGQGSISPAVSVTDENGVARTTLTTGAGTNLVYFVFGSVRAV